MKWASIFLFISLFSLTGCRKEKPVVFSGRLLLSRNFPVAISNTKLGLYQAGSPAAIGISSGSTSASATGVTDANGYFNLSFVPGKSTFLIFSGTNSNPVVLESLPGDTSFPPFSRRGFPGKEFDPAKPMFIGKTIDTAIIKVSLETAIIPEDTIGLRAQSIIGRLDKEYTGMSATAGAVIILDTIFNMLFTDFDHLDNTFNNTLYAGRKWTTVWGYLTISSYGVLFPSKLSELDEPKKEIMFYFRKR